MFRAIGYIILLWGFATFFNSSFVALDRAATESFRFIEAAAIVSQNELQNL